MRELEVACGLDGECARSALRKASRQTWLWVYFNLSGVTYGTSSYLGTQGTNYYARLNGYDIRGRQAHPALSHSPKSFLC